MEILTISMNIDLAVKIIQKMDNYCVIFVIPKKQICFRSPKNHLKKYKKILRQFFQNIQ
jgi:tRNA uridine 5-carbamoylmethylation protein Kti12